MGQYIDTKIKMIDKSWQSAEADLLSSLIHTPEQEEELIRENTIKNDRSRSNKRDQSNSESAG